MKMVVNSANLPVGRHWRVVVRCHFLLNPQEIWPPSVNTLRVLLRAVRIVGCDGACAISASPPAECESAVVIAQTSEIERSGRDWTHLGCSFVTFFVSAPAECESAVLIAQTSEIERSGRDWTHLGCSFVMWRAWWKIENGRKLSESSSRQTLASCRSVPFSPESTGDLAAEREHAARCANCWMRRSMQNFGFSSSRARICGRHRENERK